MTAYVTGAMAYALNQSQSNERKELFEGARSDSIAQLNRAEEALQQEGGLFDIVEQYFGPSTAQYLQSSLVDHIGKVRSFLSDLSVDEVDFDYLPTRRVGSAKLDPAKVAAIWDSGEKVIRIMPWTNSRWRLTRSLIHEAHHAAVLGSHDRLGYDPSNIMYSNNPNHELRDYLYNAETFTRFVQQF